MQYDTQGTEAIRAMITLRKCWLTNEEIYINQGCLHCGSAATYLIYFTNRKVQKLMLDFIAKYNCNHPSRFDLLDITDFEQQYDDFLSLLEKQVIQYAFQFAKSPCPLKFEEVDSIFENTFSLAC